MNRRPTSPVALLVVVLAALGCSRSEPTAKARQGAGSGPKLEVFVMSQCPYGTQVMDALAKVKQTLGDGFQLDVGFIGKGSTRADFESLHGPKEVAGDIAQLCAMSLAPDRYLDMIVCQNEDAAAVDTNWKTCGAKAGLDAAALATCVEGDEGPKLLAAAFKRADERKAEGSPTIFIDGKPYEGGRKPRDFVRALCAASATKPAACSALPTPPKVAAVFLSDARCKECDIRPVEAQLRGELGGLEVRHVDYGTAEGKALYAELHAAVPAFKFLPAILLAPDVEKDAEGYEALKRFLRPVGTYRELQLGGRFDPAAEICQNAGVDDDGDKMADCGDPDCKQVLACRTPEPKSLDLFVMSQCPYGAQALISMASVVEHFGKDLKLDVHFIGEGEGDSLASMHGPGEVEEDLREICALDRYRANAQFMKYMACRSEDPRSPAWQACATKSGMKPEVIQACVDKDGKRLLGASFALSKSLDISASPSLIINNHEQVSAFSPADLHREFCARNPSVARCAVPIAVAAATPAAGGAAPPPGGQCGPGGQPN